MLRSVGQTVSTGVDKAAVLHGRVQVEKVVSEGAEKQYAFPPELPSSQQPILNLRGTFSVESVKSAREHISTSALNTLDTG